MTESEVTAGQQDQLQIILKDVLHKKIKDSNAGETILVHLREIMEFVQDIVEQVEASGQSPSVDCSSGCSYCCYSQVNITPVESLLIHAFIIENFSAVELKGLKAKIRENLFLTAGKTLQDRFTIKEQAPCIFLKEDKCSVYSVRPFICRAWNSLDHKACVSAFHSDKHDSAIDASPMRNYVFQTARDLFVDLSRQMGLETGTLDIPLAISKCLKMVNPFSFLMVQIPIFLKRFEISYAQDSSCIEYFLYSKEKEKQISRSLIVSHEIYSGSIYVSKFYPEIYKELNCKYLSAACFYMIIHHAAHIFHTANHCCVNLETENSVFEHFYSRLNDFDFKIFHPRPLEKVSLRGHYHSIPMGTEMIKAHDCITH